MVKCARCGKELNYLVDSITTPHEITVYPCIPCENDVMAKIEAIWEKELDKCLDKCDD